MTAFYAQVGDTYGCFIEGDKVISQVGRNPSWHCCMASRFLSLKSSGMSPNVRSWPTAQRCCGMPQELVIGQEVSGTGWQRGNLALLIWLGIERYPPSFGFGLRSFRWSYLTRFVYGCLFRGFHTCTRGRANSEVEECKYGGRPAIGKREICQGVSMAQQQQNVWLPNRRDAIRRSG